MTGTGSSRWWRVYSLIGIALWIGATVYAGTQAEGPDGHRPILLTFAGGGALFFGIIFAVSWWQMKPRSLPELDAVLAELALTPLGGSASTAAITGSRIGRLYVALGAITTGLGMAAIAQEGLEVGNAALTIQVMVGIVVVWALAVPFVLMRVNTTWAEVLAPLGLERGSGASVTGERHGREVTIEFGPAGSITRLKNATARELSLSGDEILAYCGRGDAETWRNVKATSKKGTITVRREASTHNRPAWLWDLWLAERLAAD